jgi:hypothetical protein
MMSIGARIRMSIPDRRLKGNWEVGGIIRIPTLREARAFDERDHPLQTPETEVSLSILRFEPANLET